MIAVSLTTTKGRCPAPVEDTLWQWPFASVRLTDAANPPTEEEPVNRAPIVRSVVALGAAAFAVAIGAGVAAATPADSGRAHENGIQGTGLVADGIQGSGFTVNGIEGTG